MAVEFRQAFQRLHTYPEPVLVSIVSVLAAQGTGLEFNRISDNIVAESEAPQPEAVLAVLLWINQLPNWIPASAVVWIASQDFPDGRQMTGKVWVFARELPEKTIKVR